MEYLDGQSLHRYELAETQVVRILLGAMQCFRSRIAMMDLDPRQSKLRG